MWPEEVKLTIEQLEKHIPKSAKTCIDVGAEGKAYGEIRQPWNKNFYDYLEYRRLAVSTMDIEPNTNPSYVHDITKPTDQIGKFDIVLATHLLEHIPSDKLDKAIKNLEQMTSPESFLWVSVPNIYPHHAKPIDNEWRPNSQELAKHFSGQVLFASSFYVEHILQEHKDNPKNKISCALIKY